MLVIRWMAQCRSFLVDAYFQPSDGESHPPVVPQVHIEGSGKHEENSNGTHPRNGAQGTASVRSRRMAVGHVKDTIRLSPDLAQDHDDDVRHPKFGQSGLSRL
jgi:hypothetical protein